MHRSSTADTEEERRGAHSGRAGRRSGEGRADTRPNLSHGLGEDESGIRSFHVRGNCHDQQERGSCSNSVNRRSDCSNDEGSADRERVGGILHVVPTSGNPHTREWNSTRGAEAVASNFERTRPFEGHARDKRHEREFYPRGKVGGRHQKSSQRQESKRGFMHQSDSNEEHTAPTADNGGRLNATSSRERVRPRERPQPQQEHARGRGHSRRSYEDHGREREEGVQGGGHGKPDWHEELRRAEGKMGKAVAQWVRGGSLPEPVRFKPVKRAW